MRRDDLDAELSAFCREVDEGKHEGWVPEKSGTSENQIR